MFRFAGSNMYDKTKSFRWLAGAALVLTLVGCASPLHKAPVEDRGRVGTGLSPTRVPPGIENAGKPGYYTVKPGDTLIRIALETGQNWRDLASWNGLENPNLIEVGQVIRVAPPASDESAVASANSLPAAKPVAVGSKIETRSLDTKPLPPASSAA